ncbi:WD repeat-containing protein 47 [Culicoides brevitarsis]|uniref:WD repeat-containing protein 47 n=1 Tax=Culicoides brevitarsis TaxID=469753 RepID=UPI00307B1C5A
MAPTRLVLHEEDVIRLVLEFFNNRELYISQLSLERETGVINGKYSDDVLFLRQLVLDGQWDDTLEFIQPLEALQNFNMRHFKYTILRHKYIELLCIKSEANLGTGPSLNSVEVAVEEVVQVLAELEKLSPSKEEYSQLCLLLTLPRLVDHLHYKDWNPSKARVECFKEIFPLVEKFLPGDKTKETGPGAAKNDRLIQLAIKGLLYESCVNYCQLKATKSDAPANSIDFSKLLDTHTQGFSDSDLSLLSWIQSIPADVFSIPFEQKSLNVDVERLEKPTLETSWTEHMLITPIKPKTFPHSVMPFTRPKSAADIMTRSLLPSLDAVTVAANLKTIHENAIMSRSSFPSFHLNDKNKPVTAVPGNNSTSTSRMMTSSVDRLFENEGDVFISNHFIDFQALPCIHETNPSTGKVVDISAQGATKTTDIVLEAENERDSPITSTAKSSRRDSLNEKIYLTSSETPPVLRNEPIPVMHQQRLPPNPVNNGQQNGNAANGSELLEKFQKQKQTVVVEVNKNRPPSTASSGQSAQQASYAQSEPRNSLPSTAEDHINSAATDQNRPKFIAVTTLEDVQAVRCAEFHPSGNFYAVGSNSKTFRICEYPTLADVRENHTAYQPTVLFKRTKHHKGSIYCMAWSPQGDLIATGSNDKTVKLMRFNEVQKQLEGRETELTMHDGTVRDLCFLEDSVNKCSLLISGGAGDCKIYVTDCSTSTPFQALSGHSGHVLSLFNWGGVTFVSGSQDKTVRFWDLRTRGCVNVVTPVTSTNSNLGSPVAGVCVDPSGRLLVSGHEDSSCVLYDIRGNRIIQCFKPHATDIRSIRFSPSAYYLLTGGYDNKLVLTDLQGDLTMPLPSVVVAQHNDKVISGRWHPNDFSFISTSADKTATLWALPPM